ncbi:Rotatin, partial [Ophiophagus hannah]
MINKGNSNKFLQKHNTYEVNSFQDMVKKVAASALLPFLAVSRSAQKCALEANLIETSLEQMKHVYTELNLASLKLGKAIQRKKEDNLSRELKLAMQLLRNCFFRNESCKFVIYLPDCVIITVQEYPEG